MIEKSFVIIDDAGMHARPASLLSKTAASYPERIDIVYQDKKANMKSIVGIMSLGIKKAAEFSILIEGDSAENMMTQLENEMIEYKLIQV